MTDEKKELKGLAALEHAVELNTGKSVEYLRNTPLCEQRKEVEKRLGHSVEVTECPVNNYIITHEEVEDGVDNVFQKCVKVIKQPKGVIYLLRTKIRRILKGEYDYD